MTRPTKRELERQEARASVLRDVLAFGGLALVTAGAWLELGVGAGLATLGAGMFYIGVFRS